MRQKAVLLGNSAGLQGARRRIGSIAAILVSSVACAWSQGTAKLEFPDEGSRDVWVASGLPDGPLPETLETEAKTPEVSLLKASPKDYVFVWDHRSGNIAYKRVSDIKGKWSVKPEEFKLIGLVRVSVEYKGDPVASAYVSLKDAARRQSVLLDPDAKGVAEFRGVSPGAVTIETIYTSAGKTRPPLKQVLQLSLKHDSPDLEFAQAIGEEVAVAAEVKAQERAAGSQEKVPPQERERKPQGGNIWVTMLIALILLAAGIFGVWKLMIYLNQHPDQVGKQLGKLGAPVPDPSFDPGGSPVAPPAQPAPPERIILDDISQSAPAPQAAPAPASAPVPIASSSSIPRLVRENGQVFQIIDGANVVSREGGQSVSLVGEDSVSRRHAELIRTGAQVTVKDLGSTNGTYVNGVKVVGEAPLNPGDQVQFGTVRLRFEE